MRARNCPEAIGERRHPRLVHGSEKLEREVQVLGRHPGRTGRRIAERTRGIVQ
jgi:hypothetical protein